MPISPNPTPQRLGFHVVPGGATISVWAPHAASLDLCLFDARGHESRVPLLGPEHGVWHAMIPGVKHGQRYGLRAHGKWDPAQGLLYNPSRLLLDPYARGLDGPLVREREQGYEATLSAPDERDSAPFVPRGVLLDPGQAQGSSPALRRVPWDETVIYEAHVVGLTKRLPGVPEAQRGTYAALGHDAVTRHLARLGVTTLELLPIHAHASEPHLDRLGLANYWGYNTLGFFAPHAAYATAAARRAGPQAVLDELRGAIDRLHRAGVEVLLDVVYNHTCEGGVGGRHVSWRGLDNRAYYRHRDGSPGTLEDTTGTGNTLDFGEPHVVQMALDSLRYWVAEVGVDGFRFDLAATLARAGNGFDPRHPLLVALATDPLLSGTKLIAEPWDVGLGGWQTGNFPPPFAEWNDRFRDTVRGFWLSDAASAGRKGGSHGVRDLATRLAGSSDLFGHGDPPLTRGPLASINFVTAHDGFTLHDLTAYAAKHNQANGEDGRDGSDHNNSWNHGAEGPTEDPAVLAARRRSARNMIGTLLLSAGVPMLTAGDESGRTQGGNNNAYAQDNETSWIDWNLASEEQDLAATVSYLLEQRREHAVLRPRTFYEGRDRDATRRDDLAWFTAQGQPESEGWWHDSSVRALQMLRSVTGDRDALIIINGYASDLVAQIPLDGGPGWSLAWDSAWESPGSPEALHSRRTEGGLAPGASITLAPLTMRLYLGA